jgi:hypothetical protein
MNALTFPQIDFLLSFFSTYLQKKNKLVIFTYIDFTFYEKLVFIELYLSFVSQFEECS